MNNNQFEDFLQKLNKKGSGKPKLIKEAFDKKIFQKLVFAALWKGTRKRMEKKSNGFTD